MTPCNQSSLEFAPHFSREVVARFDGGTMISDAGGLLLRETDRRLKLLPRRTRCSRDPRWGSASVEQMVAQRVCALALGAEDLTDPGQLRQDALLAVRAGKEPVEEEPLTGKSTRNRVELGTEQPSRYKKIHYHQEAIDELLTGVFLEAHEQAPERIVLDLDVTDLPLHGQREGRFLHGYYDSYCYLPLYIFCGEHRLCARLRTAGQDASVGSLEEVRRIVAQSRQVWPEVEIILRADSGFCRDERMGWCEQNGVGCGFGFARNERVRQRTAPQMAEAARPAPALATNTQTPPQSRPVSSRPIEDTRGRAGPPALPPRTNPNYASSQPSRALLAAPRAPTDRSLALRRSLVREAG